ncbi:MAG: SDR family oxidoreductase [SAR86 cluster bacterium]|nr:SDR family oxidoreductase [SAR86 cluster bacterium]
MHVIISGGLGHIGSKLIRFLLNKNLKVTCIDNLSTQRISSLKGVIQNKNFNFFEIDIAKEPNKALDVLKKLDCNSFIHLGAITNAEASHDNPKQLFENNLSATKNTIEICSNLNFQLLFPSSTSVYGSAEDNVYEDDESFINPQSPYAECKVKEEELILNSKISNSAILRLGTIFGTSPGMRFHTAVNKFCWQAIMKMPITVWKTALHQHRPYLDINDACKAFFFFLKKEEQYGSIFNVNTENYTVSEILESITKYASNLNIEFVDSKIMNQLSYLVLNDKIKEIGFKFEGSLDRGISDTFEWFKNEKYF